MNPHEAGLLARPVTVLFSSAGNEALHGFVDDLRRRAPLWTLVGTDCRVDAAGLYRCDRACTTPRRSDPSYLGVLADLCDREGVDVVFPLSTEDQSYFSRPDVAERLAPRLVVVSRPGPVHAANSKVALFRAIAREAPDLLPEYEVVSDADIAMRALERLTTAHGAALLKLDVGSGGASMLCVGEPVADPAPAEGRRYWPFAAVADVMADPERCRALPAEIEWLVRAPASSWPRLAIAYLPGEELSVDVLSDCGSPLAGTVRLRHKAIGGLATYAETIRADDVLEAAFRVTERLGLSYVNNVQFRRDASGAPKLLEVNPRVPGTIGLTVEAGLNLPLAAICLALGERLQLPEPEIGVRVTRYHGSLYTRRLAPSAEGGR